MAFERYVSQTVDKNNVVYGLQDKDARDILETKANVDGSYQQMTVGNAEQIVSTVGIEDQVPYQFRTSGGSIDIGDRENDKIVGGTVAWNQLADEVTEPFVLLKSGERTKNWSTGLVKSRYNHVYMLSTSLSDIVESTVANTNTLGFEYGANISQIPLVVGRHNAVYRAIKQDSVANPSIYFFLFSNASDATSCTLSNTQLFDLTAMFGSTIADYILSLETANAGDGVAWFRKLFPKPYYAYNPGELLSVEGLQSHDMTGFNQWDEEWEIGSLTNGVPVVNANDIRSKNFCRCVPGAAYYCHVGSATSQYFVRVVFYDGEKNFISHEWTSNLTFTVPDNAQYFKITTQDADGAKYGNTYKNDICINLHWDGERDGEYEPYVKHSYPLDSDLVLRGIPKLDSNNKLYYDGDTYEPDGTVTRRYSVVDLGTLTWAGASYGSNYRYNAPLSPAPKNSTYYVPANAVCTKYISSHLAVDHGTSVDAGIFTIINNKIYIIDASNYTDAAFKTAMSGVYLVYELATPTTETAEPFSDPQIVDDWGTEEYVTDSIVPVGHDTRYQPNLRAKLEMSPDSPEGDGDYIVRQSNGENTYVPLVIPAELPANPSTDGTYSLKVTVADGTATLAWVSE